MSSLLTITHNYIKTQTTTFIAAVGFPELDFDSNGLISEGAPVAPTSVRAMEVSGTFMNSPTKRDRMVRVQDQWVWQLVLKFPRPVSLEDFKDLLSVDFRVPRDYLSETNPAIFLDLEDFLVSHPVEEQGSAQGTEVRFTLRAWLRPL